MKNHVTRQIKTPHEEFGRHGIKIQEAFEDLKSWGNSIPSPKTSLEEENSQKDEEKGKNALEVEATRPQVCETVMKIIVFSMHAQGAPTHARGA